MRKENEPDEATAVVRRWPALRGEAKEAWQFIWRRAGGRPDTLWISYSELAAEQGKSDRSARRWIDRLAEFHLIEVVERAANQVRVYVKEPREVCRARGTEGITERPIIAQLENPPSSADVHANSAGHIEQASGLAQRAVDGTPPPDHGGSAAEPPHNRRTSAAATFGEETRKRAPLPSVLSEPLNTEGTDPRSAAPAAAVPPHNRRDVDDGPAPIGAAIAGLVQRFVDGPTPAEKQRQVDDLVRQIVSRVADPKLRQSPCVRVARAIVDGRLPSKELDAMFVHLEKACRKDPSRARWICFVGTAQRIFERHEIDWPKAPVPAARG